ncbi:MAG: hypothetical protein ACHQFZ_04055 [Acidimicrobiales bacterium]
MTHSALGAERHRRPRIAVALLMVLGLAVAGGPIEASGTMAPQPLLIARVPGTATLYVVGSVTCPQNLCLRLYRTTVAATAFTQLTLPPVAPASGSVTGTLDHLVFASPTVGYALLDATGTPKLYATFDGARTWRRWKLTTPGIVESIAATPRTLYLEVAFCAVTVPYCDHFRVARSPLTADHWTSTAIPDSATSAQGSIFGPLAAHGDEVWVTETGSRAYLARSLDAGHHFTLLPAPQLLSVTGCTLSADSATSLWAQCPTGLQESFWFSANAARSWTYVVTPRPVFGTGGGFFDPVSASLAYLAGGSSFDTLLRVTNGARDVTAAGRLVCPSLLGLRFTDLDHGLAVCTAYTLSYLEVTADGGATWRRVAIALS